MTFAPLQNLVDKIDALKKERLEAEELLKTENLSEEDKLKAESTISKNTEEEKKLFKQFTNIGNQIKTGTYSDPIYY
jgi:hypothetical protein